MFYCVVLGAYEERRIPRASMVQLRVGHSLLDLIVDEAANTQGWQGLDHFCLRIEPWDEAVIAKHLRSFGVEIIERGARFGAQGSGPSLYVRDPFGMVVELKGPAAPIESALPVLKTERLTLRPTLMADAQAFYPLFADKETMQFWSHAPVTTLADVQRIIARNLAPQNKPDSSFAVTLDGERAIGCINFYDESDGMAGLGYILEKLHWGNGYICEALHSLIAHGFDTLHLARIWLEVDPRNHASIRVAEKCGFTAEGTQRHAFLMDGAYLDSAYFGLLREDWIKTRDEISPSVK